MSASAMHRLNFKFRHWSVRTQLFFLVGALLTPLTAVLAWLLVHDLDRIHNGSKAEVMHLAEHTAYRVQRDLDDSHHMLERVAQRRLVQAMSPSQCDPVVAHMVEMTAEFTSMIVRDLQGQVVCTFAPKEQDGLEAAAIPITSDTLQNDDFYVSGPVRNPNSGRWMVSLSHPIFSDTGQKIGVVTMARDLLAMGATVMEQVPSDALVAVIHPNGMTVLRSQSPLDFIGKPTQMKAESAVKGVSQGYLVTQDMKGVSRLFAFSAVDGVGWRVVAGRAESVVYAQYWQTLQSTVAASALTLGLAIALAWRFGTAITRPYAQLVDAAAKVAHGETQVRASLTGSSEVESLSRQFNHMLHVLGQDEILLKANELRFRTLIEWSPEPTFVHRDGVLLYVNPAAVQLFGAASPQALVGASLFTLLHPDFHASTQARIDEVLTDGAGLAAPAAEIIFLRVDGTPVEVRVDGISVLFDGQACVLTLARDITETKKAHTALQAAVHEKVGLLNEVHHRVKNNLQVIASLLRLESRRSTLPHTKSVLDDMQGRIRSMALLHETLYRSGTFAGIDLGNYLRQLSTQSFRMMLTQGEPIGLELDVCTVTVSMDQATPCGLLVNELISNCLKHAFPNTQGGKVRVSLRQVGGDVGTDMRLELQVSDNGVGLGPDFEASKSQSLGLQLVSDLARQLGGQLVVGNTGGASFTVVFSPDTLQGPVASV